MFRLQNKHIEVFTEFMEAHPDLAKGRLSVSNARDQFKCLWLDLANKLNSVGMGERNIEKWQKTWSDYKGNLKKKAAEIQKHQKGTGGGPPPQKSLTEFELRILEVLGTIFYAGVGVEERGLNVGIENDVSKCIESISPIPSTGIEPISPMPSTCIEPISPMPSTSKGQNNQEDPKETKRKSSELDHDYLFSKRMRLPRKKRRKILLQHMKKQ